MLLSSPAFKHGEDIPRIYTCDGEDVNPPLAITDVPKSAESLVLVMDDPDATGGGVFVHWTVWNIDPSITEIPQDFVPIGATEGITSFEREGYGGPCPPQGAEPHRYFFKLYALDTVLELNSDVDAVKLEQAIEDHVLDSAQLMGRYGRDA